MRNSDNFDKINAAGRDIIESEHDILNRKGIRVDKSVIKKDTLTPQWANIKGQYLISPIYGGNGRVLIKEDAYKSRFDCSKCGGLKHLGVVCERCKGTGHVRDEPCWECAVNSEKTADVLGGKISLGFVPCDQCKGIGGTIVIPEEGQKNTTTGNVLAISDREILEVRVGDKVIFTSYSGSPFKFLEEDLRIIIERDLLGKVKQLKKNVDGLSEGTYAELANSGVPRE